MGAGLAAGLGVCDAFFAKKLEMVCCVPFCDDLGCDDDWVLFGAIGLFVGLRRMAGVRVEKAS